MRCRLLRLPVEAIVMPVMLGTVICGGCERRPDKPGRAQPPAATESKEPAQVPRGGTAPTGADSLIERLESLEAAQVKGSIEGAARTGPARKVVPLVPLPGDWVLQPDFSDEFEGAALDTDKWKHDVPSWGAWSWAPENAFVKDGSLHIRMQYKVHSRGSKSQKLQKVYYTSGIVRSRKRILHGYFEANIKAAPRFPGVCPAFWADYAGEKDRRTEIDFVELTMRANRGPEVIDTNTHVAYHTSLPQEDTPLHEHVQTVLPFDPRDDFHVYSCLWDEQKIVWYVDGKIVRERANDYWDQPLVMTISMGLRRPLKGDPLGKFARTAGFPTTFETEYVRVWQQAAEPTEVEAAPITQAGRIAAARIAPENLQRLGYDENSPLGICGSSFGAPYLPYLGLTWTRMGVPEFTPKKAEAWLKKYGDRFPFSDSAKTVLDAGGQVLGLINFKDTARWVKSGDEAYLDVVRRCSRNMVATHKDRVRYWEVINEPDCFSPGVSPQQTARIVKAAIAGAREADSACFLLSPCPTSITYMEALLDEGIGPLVDGFAFHLYSHGGAMRDCIRDWKELYADYDFGDKPVWITETGWRSNVIHAEGKEGKQQWIRHLEDQARMLVKGHVRMLAEGIDRIIWYNLTDVNSAGAAENFGLLWSAGGQRGNGKQGTGWEIECDHPALKPSGLAGHVFAKTLGLCPRLSREIPAGVGVHLFEFATDAGPVLVAWARGACVLPVPAAGTVIRVTDLYGGARNLPARNGMGELRLGPAPVYIRGLDTDRLAQVPCRVSARPELGRFAGERRPRVRWQPEGQWRVSSAPVIRAGWGSGSKRVRDPFVFKDADAYRMYFSGYWGKQDVLMAESVDGVSWKTYAHCEPVLHWTRGAGLPGGAAVLRDDDGAYRMWYTFHPEGTWGGGREIGCAVSPDGIRWKRFAGNPILGRDAEGICRNPSSLSVVRRDGTYHLWMSGPGICHATSTDGIDWRIHGSIEIDKDLPGALLSPGVIVEDGAFVMAFHNYDWDKKKGTLGFAGSTDGRHWKCGYLPPLENATGPSPLVRVDKDWAVYFCRRFEIWAARIPVQ